VQRLLDRMAILDCINRYVRGLDRHDDELVASAYHEGALDHHGGFLGTPAEFIPWANELHAADWVSHQHHITSHTADLDGDVAHAESYCIGTFLRKDEPVVDMAGGRYIDRLERRNGEWRIVAPRGRDRVGLRRRQHKLAFQRRPVSRRDLGPIGLVIPPAARRR
jgi:SnoaL-like domain